MSGDKSFPRSADDDAPVRASDVSVNDNQLVGSGDFFPLITLGGDSASSTTASSTYGSKVEHFQSWLEFGTVIPSNAQLQAVFVAQVDPSTDQIDIRVRNTTEPETILEQTGITGALQEITIGPTNYTPTTTSSPVEIVTQTRNGDNATTVTLNDATLLFGLGF